MSKFFEDIGDVLSYPVKETYDIVTGSPKANSLGDIWNNTAGPGNPFQELESDAPGAQLYKGLTGGDLSAIFQAPSWQDLGKPGQAFAGQIDQDNKILPTSFQPYAEPLEAFALDVFNPFAGAALQTAYQGGEEQANQKGFDWGELGKNAAINFGTAGITSGVNSALTGANQANALSAFQSSPNSLESAFNGSNNIDSLTNAAANFAPNETANALASTSANALNSVGGIPYMQAATDGFNPNMIGASQSIIPSAQGLQSSGSGIQDSAYKAALQGAKSLAPNALNATLNPPGAEAVSGAFDGFSSPSLTATAPQSSWGDVLNAFGGDAVNTPNPNGPRIDAASFDQSVGRLAANDLLQQNQARDLSLPAGQYQADQNTPYQNQLNSISGGATQAYTDLLNETNNANAYYGIIDSNPGLTSDQLNTYLTDPNAIGEINNADAYQNILNNNAGLTADQLNAYLADPSSGVLGQFTVPTSAAADFANIKQPTYPNSFFTPGQMFPVPADISAFNGVQPLGPLNSSLL